MWKLPGRSSGSYLPTAVLISSDLPDKTRLFDLILYVSSTSFSYKGTGPPWFNSTKLGLMCLAQEHNTVTPVRLKPAAPRASQAWGVAGSSVIGVTVTRPVPMCTTLAFGAPCSMPVKLGHWPSQTFSVCKATIGPWSDISATSSQRLWPQYGQERYWLSLSSSTLTSFWERLREAQDDLEEIDREPLPWVEAYNSRPPSNGNLEIRCDICCMCS